MDGEHMFHRCEEQNYGLTGVVRKEVASPPKKNVYDLYFPSSGIQEEVSETDPFVNSPLTTYQTVDGEMMADTSSSATASSRQDKSWLARQWSDIDKKVMKPLLTHSNPTLLDTLPNRCLPLGRIFTSAVQLANHPLMSRDESTDTDLATFQKVNIYRVSPFPVRVRILDTLCS